MSNHRIRPNGNLILLVVHKNKAGRITITDFSQLANDYIRYMINEFRPAWIYKIQGRKYLVALVDWDNVIPDLAHAKILVTRHVNEVGIEEIS